MHCPASDARRFVDRAELWVEPENPDALAEVILTLYYDPNRRATQQLSDRAATGQETAPLGSTAPALPGE